VGLGGDQHITVRMQEGTEVRGRSVSWSNLGVGLFVKFLQDRQIMYIGLVISPNSDLEHLVHPRSYQCDPFVARATEQLIVDDHTMQFKPALVPFSRRLLSPTLVRRLEWRRTLLQATLTAGSGARLQRLQPRLQPRLRTWMTLRARRARST